MVQREDLLEKSVDEIQHILEESAAEWAAEIESMSEEEILLKEQELIGHMDDNDAYLKGVSYEIAKEVTFDNQAFDQKTVRNFIVDFINTQEVEWNYSLGLFQLVKIWKDISIDRIQYHAYDSTLRILGQCKFKGYESWRKILTVNEYLTTCHNDYVRDTSYMMYLSQLHNMLIDALKRFNPPVEEEAAVN